MVQCVPWRTCSFSEKPMDRFSLFASLREPLGVTLKGTSLCFKYSLTTAQIFEVLRDIFGKDVWGLAKDNPAFKMVTVQTSTEITFGSWVIDQPLPLRDLSSLKIGKHEDPPRQWQYLSLHSALGLLSVLSEDQARRLVGDDSTLMCSGTSMSTQCGLGSASIFTDVNDGEFLYISRMPPLNAKCRTTPVIPVVVNGSKLAPYKERVPQTASEVSRRRSRRTSSVA
jgi:hypothetical protein